MALALRNIINKKQGSGTLAWPGLDAKMALPSGRPPACAGDLYVGVAGGSWTTESIEGLYEIVGVRLFISRRGACTTVENWPEQYIYAGFGGNLLTSGLLYMAERIRAWVHLDANAEAVMNEANSLLDQDFGQDGSTVIGFTEPLRFLGASNPEIKAASWWTGQETSPEPYGGLFMTVDFGQAGRIQRIEGMV